MTIPLTPAVIEKFKDFLVNPANYGCSYKPLHEVFVDGDHYEPQDKLFDAYIDYIQKPLPKVVFYIIMQEEFPELRGCDEWDEIAKDGKQVHRVGNLGYKLKLNIAEPKEGGRQ